MEAQENGYSFGVSKGNVIILSTSPTTSLQGDAILGISTHSTIYTRIQHRYSAQIALREVKNREVAVRTEVSRKKWNGNKINPLPLWVAHCNRKVYSKARLG